MAKIAGSLVFSIDEDFGKKLSKELKELHKRLGSLEELMDAIGEKLLDSTHERMSREEDPEGNRWQELSPNYAAAKKALYGDKLMLQITENLFSTLVWQSGSDFVQVGSPLIYSGTQQHGLPDKNVEARPYLGLSLEDERTVYELIEDYILEALA